MRLDFSNEPDPGHESRRPGRVTGHPSSDEIPPSTGRDSSAGGELFEVRYGGTVIEEQPSLVVARAFDTGEEIVLFDAARHGCDTMFVEEFDPSAVASRTADTVLERDGRTAFGVEVEVIDNIDFRDDEGVIRLINGDAISAEQLRADGFDALSVTVVTVDGTRHVVVEEELA